MSSARARSLEYTATSRVVCEAVCEGTRLLEPRRVERDVGVALHAMLAVPVGLAVPRRRQDRSRALRSARIRGSILYRSRMPIVQVTALRQRVGVDLDVVSRAIVLAVSRELGEDPSGTWVTWQTLAPGGYREGERRCARSSSRRRRIHRSCG